MAVRDVVMAAAGALGGEKIYVEDVFSTYLYTGNGSTQTITNGIDLDGEGGLVWEKARSYGYGHSLVDTVRGAGNYIATESSSAQTYYPQIVSAFNSNGYSIGGAIGGYNVSGTAYASWTFRKAEKFFDVVTWTGNGVYGREISHNLASNPGCVIVKRLDTSGNWTVRHRAATGALYLNLTTAQQASHWDIVGTSSTTITLSADANVNTSGATYVAYLFAHDAGGFGDDGTENVISCGSFTTDGSGNATVNLGYEPQWVLVKRTDSIGSWWLTDTMREMTVVSGDNVKALFANTSAAEAAAKEVRPNATGFSVGPSGNLSASANWIYIAIRRGPMKTPTSGTEVFSPALSSASTGTAITTGFPVDAQIFGFTGLTQDKWALDRLRGITTTPTETSARVLATNKTDFEIGNVGATRYWNNTGFQIGSYAAGYSTAYWNFRRAPGFFDVVCYTGTGVERTVNHTLGVAPELMIVKIRSSAGYIWEVWSAYTNVTAPYGHDGLKLNLTNAAGATGYFPTDPTESVFTVSNNNQVNISGDTFVSYLFATCPGISKVGSYTGNGSNQTINCGFSAGARFVLIKRTDSTGDWYVWDSSRGIVSGNDPHLSLNTTAAEVTTDDSVDTDNTGFIVNQNSATNINVSSASYIYMSIA